jgi:multiple sugar transport system substrate-binding protein
LLDEEGVKMNSFLCFTVALCLFTAPALPAAAALTFWTTEVERDRQRVQEAIAAEFTRTSGIAVRVVPVDENLLAERVTAAYAARSLPDVIFHPIEFTVGWCEAGILDAPAATAAVRALGEETFAPGPLALARCGEGYAAVPADGWGQLLLYRKDLFAEKQLPPPDSWERILAAAAALHNPPLLWGFHTATDPGQNYTQQVFEHLALSNGVRLAPSGGRVDLNTPEMIAVLEFYRQLAGFSPPGNLYWLHSRLDYLSGRAAMIVWSPFILDELSGLRRDQPVLPDLARGEPGFLARNTGFVGRIQGPRGSAQYGQAAYFGITRDADREAAGAWVRFLATEGYLDWLGMAAEGKLPVRHGTLDQPRRFIDGWSGLEFGVTTRARIDRFYGPETAAALISGAAKFDRWGFEEGKGALVSRIYGTKIIPQMLKRFLDGEISAERAAEMMTERVRALE